jgi:hypothetical protein
MGWPLGDPAAQKYTSTLPRPLVLSQFWASM